MLFFILFSNFFLLTIEIGVLAFITTVIIIVVAVIIKIIKIKQLKKSKP